MIKPKKQKIKPEFESFDDKDIFESFDDNDDISIAM